MSKKDARHLSAEAQEALRRRAVAAVGGGMSQAEAARVFGVSRQSVNTWVGRFKERGARGLRTGARGRPSQSRLAPYQAATAVRLIEGRCPDQLKLPFALWTRQAVRELLRRKFGLEVSVWTAGRYLGHWGFTPQKPARRAFEQDPEAVRQWLKEEYPSIRWEARRRGAEIHWGDEMGMRSDHQTGTSYGRRGQTPVVPGTGQRFRCSMVSSVTNRGRMAFMVFRGRFTAGVFLVFVGRLVRLVGRRIFLIVDRHPVHRSGRVKRWLKRHAEDIRMFFLPAYSPELNPDELLNQDVKSNAVGRQRPSNQADMMGQVRSYLRRTQRCPQAVRQYFQEEHVRYART